MKRIPPTVPTPKSGHTMYHVSGIANGTDKPLTWLSTPNILQAEKKAEDITSRGWTDVVVIQVTVVDLSDLKSGRELANALRIER